MHSDQDIEVCYQTLDIGFSASYQEARKAYIQLIQRWHPDRFENFPPLQAHAVRMTQKINAAFEVLSAILPACESRADLEFFNSFEFHAADWSAYYAASTEYADEYSDEVPESQIERAIKRPSSISRGMCGVTNTLLYPIKMLTDLTVYLIFERPIVPLVAGFIVFISL